MKELVLGQPSSVPHVTGRVVRTRSGTVFCRAHTSLSCFSRCRVKMEHFRTRHTMSDSSQQSACPFGHTRRSHPLKPPGGHKDESPRANNGSSNTNAQKLPEHLQKYMQQSGEYLPSSLSSKPTPSSIPRLSPTSQYPHHRWHYPSPQRFYLALKRKGYLVEEDDIDHIISIHNTVNENTWREVLRWELNLHWQHCTDIRLEKFQGRPQDLSPKAWLRMAVGYRRPFDRHDWIVNRCGERVRYIIDFYEGKAEDDATSVHLDVRPELHTWNGLKDRMRMAFRNLSGTNQIPEERFEHLLKELSTREQMSTSEGGHVLPQEDVWNDEDSNHGSLMTWNDSSSASGASEASGCPVVGHPTASKESL